MESQSGLDSLNFTVNCQHMFKKIRIAISYLICPEILNRIWDYRFFLDECGIEVEEYLEVATYVDVFLTLISLVLITILTIFGPIIILLCGKFILELI